MPRFEPTATVRSTRKEAKLRPFWLAPFLAVLCLLSVATHVHAQTIQTNLRISGEPSELSSTIDGAVVTPALSAGGFTGRLVATGTGSVNFVPALHGNGVFFLNCCANANRAYYRFTGPLVGSIFNMQRGQISFQLKSRYSFSQRQQAAASPRYAFDVRDGDPANHLFSFLTQISSGRLLFVYRAGGAPQFYYAPAGSEDALFGSGVVLDVTITWDGSTSSLLLNGQQVHSAAYVPRAPNWTAASNFNLGAFEYSTAGGYNVSDDVIDEFTVASPQYIADSTPPTVTFSAPSEGAEIDGVQTVSATALDQSAIDNVQFFVNGVALGPPLPGPGPSYTQNWDTAGISNGDYVLIARAQDVSGNIGTASIAVKVKHEFRIGSRVYASRSTPLHADASAQSAVATTLIQGAFATIADGPVSTSGDIWWRVTLDDGQVGWVTEDTLLIFVPLQLPVNRWIVTTPSYTGAPDGGMLYPQAWVNKGLYDPRTHRTIFVDHWWDEIRGGSIFGNGVFAYDPLKNLFEVLKLSNWYAQTFPGGHYETHALPANASDPTPPDSHPLSNHELVPELNAVYRVNGVNISLPEQDRSLVNSTWKLDLTTRSWSLVSSPTTDPNYPPNDWSAPGGVVFDPIGGQLVYFTLSNCGCAGTATYLFDLETGRWTAVPRDPASFNVYVAGAGYSYDPLRRRVLALGGSNFLSSGRNHLWSYSIAENSWTRLADAPAAAMAPGFAYDAKNDVFLALVGNVTYVYNPVANSWANLGATIQRPPQLPNWQAVSYDQAHDVFVFQGGSWDAPLFGLFRYDPTQPPTGGDSTPPTVTITSPAQGATIQGTVLITASASDNQAVSGVQFQIDGLDLGPIVGGAGPSYSRSWNSTASSDGPHTITAVARDTSGNTKATSISVTVTNSTATPPVISSVAASNISAGAATITWNTNEAASSQVAYGTTTAYGQLTPLDSALVNAHSVTLSGLSASTTYHYQVRSADTQGAAASSGDFTFTTAAAPVALPVLLHVSADDSEVGGATNGSVVTPTVTPGGFTGQVMVRGAGSVNFTPAQTGHGVYFLRCCTNAATAYYKFTGPTVGDVFNLNEGEISFYLKSRYAFASRPTGARYAFDVRDNDAAKHRFYFLTQVSAGSLQFAYSVGGATKFYFVPKGMEDVLFGNGVTLKVTITWDGSTSRLYLNDGLVQSGSYVKPAVNWTSSSVFALGAYEYLSYGGYNVLDDVVDEFVVRGPGIVADTTSPTVAFTAPAAGATVFGTIGITVDADDDGTVGGVQLQLDGTTIAAAMGGNGTTYTHTWNTTTVANGGHSLKAIARDAAGNTAEATVAITVDNPAISPVISNVAASNISAGGATITWTTNKAASSQVAYGPTTAYGQLTPLDSALVTAHSVTLSGLSPSMTYHYQVRSTDVQGLAASSGDFTFTTAAAPVGLPVRLHLAADASEVTGVTNGSVVTPAVTPAGFTGQVMVRGAGSVNFTPAQTGNGVYFQRCCTNAATAYYKFTGPTVGDIFNVNEGEISFYLKSRYAFASRPTSARYAFDVRDNDAAKHRFYFLTQVSSGSLLFAYSVGGATKFYFVPKGTEDVLFGNGVTLKVTITWDGSTSRLYLNDGLVQSGSYVKPSVTWTSNSVFALGAYEYLSYGAYNVLDDVVDEFVVRGPAPLSGTIALNGRGSSGAAITGLTAPSFEPSEFLTGGLFSMSSERLPEGLLGRSRFAESVLPAAISRTRRRGQPTSASD